MPHRPVRRLVVPLDGSPQANAALPLATGLAQALDLPVLLLRAVDEPAETRRAERQLLGVSLELEHNQLRVERRVLPPTDDAAQSVERHLADGDLVLLGLAARPDLGSLPRRLLAASAAPVLLRQAGGRRVRRVRRMAVVRGGRAADVAADLAQRLDVPLEERGAPDLADLTWLDDVDLLVVDRGLVEAARAAVRVVPVILA